MKEKLTLKYVQDGIITAALLKMAKKFNQFFLIPDPLYGRWVTP